MSFMRRWYVSPFKSMRCRTIYVRRIIYIIVASARPLSICLVLLVLDCTSYIVNNENRIPLPYKIISLSHLNRDRSKAFADQQQRQIQLAWEGDCQGSSLSGQQLVRTAACQDRKSSLLLSNNDIRGKGKFRFMASFSPAIYLFVVAHV